MNIRKRYSQRKAHKLFENERHVDLRTTSSLLDESLWKQADALNDDADEVASNISGELILSKPTPQLENRSDSNTDPRNLYEEQETIHGEPDMNVLDKNLNREVQTDPLQGESYPGRDQLMKNDQINQQSYYGGGMTEDYMPTRAQKTPTTQMGRDDWLQKMNPFATPVAFDLFIDMVGKFDTITKEQVDAMNPKLTKLLVDSGILQEGEYKVDRSRLDPITERMRNIGRDFSKVTLKELQEYISGTPASQQTAPAGTNPSGGGGYGGGAGGGTTRQPAIQQQPANQGDVSAMLEKVGTFKLADIKDKIQVSEKARQFIDVAIAKNPNIDLNEFTSWTPENFRQEQLSLVEDEGSGAAQAEPEKKTWKQKLIDQIPEPIKKLKDPLQRFHKFMSSQLETDAPAVQMEVLRAVFSIADDLIAQQAESSKESGQPLQLAEPEPLQLETEQQAAQPTEEALQLVEEPTAEQVTNQQQPVEHQTYNPALDQDRFSNPDEELDLVRRSLEHYGVTNYPHDMNAEQLRDWAHQSGHRTALRIIMEKTNMRSAKNRMKRSAAWISDIGETITSVEVEFESWAERTHFLKQATSIFSGTYMRSVKESPDGNQLTAVVDFPGNQAEAIREVGSMLSEWDQYYSDQRSNMPSHQAARMTVEDVRKFSPKHARRMEAAGIEWVDEAKYKAAYREQMREAIKTAASATRTAFKMRANGKSINEVIGLVSHAAKSGKYTKRDADVACIMMHRLAQLTCENREDIGYDDLMIETNSAVERLAAKSGVAVPVYIKTAAKQIRAVDHTLYNMDHAGADKDFNYADPLDVNWTLYRGTEGKKGGKVHTCKSPAMAMSYAKKAGDGNYLVVGESILDDAYWGTYTIKVEKGIVVNYAKIPVDASGKRVAGKQDNTKVVQARRRYVAIYRALSKRKLIAQSDQFYTSPYQDWAKTDEEIDQRYDEAVAEDQKRKDVRNKVDDWIRRLNRELMQRYPQEAGEFPTQEKADQKYEELLAANPDVLGAPRTGG